MKKIDEKLMEKYLNRELERYNYRGRKEYLMKEAYWLVELTDGTIFVYGKPSINTRFCFGENGYDCDVANKAANEARTNEDLFRKENLSGIDKNIELLRDGPKDGRILWVATTHGIADYLNEGYEWDRELVNGTTMIPDEENRKRLLEGYEIVRERFAKRIETYLKRFGLSKVRAWTYWVDA